MDSVDLSRRSSGPQRFEIDAGNDGKQITDYGAVAIDTAVPIIGARN